MSLPTSRVPGFARGPPRATGKLARFLKMPEVSGLESVQDRHRQVDQECRHDRRQQHERGLLTPFFLRIALQYQRTDWV